MNTPLVRRRALLVLGMHRSGTSAATRVANLLGADLSEHLIAPGSDNPAGFWEHADAVKINEDLLEGLGRTWYDMCEMPCGWTETKVARDALERIETLIQRDFAHSTLCAIKDPRICLTAPLWIRALSASGFDADCVFVVRDPREVVDSLHARNDWVREPLFLMWVQYLLAAEAATRGCRRVLITYDEVLADWRAAMARVSRELTLEWPVEVDAAAADVEAFLQHGRRHHRAAPLNANEGEMPELAAQLYRACVDISGGEGRWRAISKLQKPFEHVSELYAAHVGQLLKLRWDAEGRAQAADQRFVDEHLRAENLAALGHQLTGLQDEFRDLSVGFRREMSELQQVLALKDSATQALSIELSGKESTIQTLSSELSEKGSTIQTLSSELSGKESTIQTLSSELSGKESTIQTLLSELSGKESRIHVLSSEVSSTMARIDELLASTCWRITAPLRLFRMGLSPRRWKAGSGRAVKRIYDHLPFSSRARLALKGVIFRALAPLVHNTRSYRAWQAYEMHRGRAPIKAVDSQALKQKPVATDSQRHGASRVLGDLYCQANGDSSSDYVPMDDTPVDLSKVDVRAIAFYLPQFHPIPENDEWWGRGFTEWTNVSKAVPQFAGHYQPRLPGELGFYDLRIVDIMRRQIELAMHYGLQGFCFHYYWFGGRRLLERPLEQFVANKDIDFPFCICWANENWSRRWDGMDQDILVGQSHSPEDDIAFITALEPLLRDRRYIRIDGKPLIVLYRPSILPDAKATQRRWRQHCLKCGIGEIMLAMVQFDVEDPREFGFDVAIEFPPHKLARGLDPINDQLHIVNSEYSGYVVDYDAVLERVRERPAVNFDMIGGVFPSWDNEARKPGRGYTFANATPARYRKWMDLAIDYARKHPVAGERIVFINAWNEWAEGAYLEPDRRYGYAFLEQTREALLASGTSRGERVSRVAIVSHDAHPHGAQYLALHMARAYRESFGFEVDVVLLGGGRLRDEFSKGSTLHDLDGIDPEGDEACRVARELHASGVRYAIANTTVSGLFAKTLKDAGLRVVSLVHELPGVIRENHLLKHARSLANYADCVVFPAESVRAGFENCVDIDIPRTVIRPQGLYKLNRFASFQSRATAAQQLRRRLNIPEASRIILCLGYADHRKGIDLFVEIGIWLMRQREDVHFLWVGHFDTSLESNILKAVRGAGLRDRFHFPGIDADTDLYYAGADVYALTSREDPFPSVVMEALQVGVPVVGFAGAGGFTDLLDQGAGLVVPMGDVAAFGSAVSALLADPPRAQALGARGRVLIESHYSFRTYLFDLLDLLGCPLPKVSVIVPNYNYACYLPNRIDSILKQDVPIYELIILDDASTDDSVEVIERLAGERGMPLRFVCNSENSGSVFRQWEKGVVLARGDFVWIAEADDLSAPAFLQTLLEAMTDSQVAMAYCQSKQIDADGQVLADDYLGYTDDISTTKWLTPYRENGLSEINNCLAVKNTIPNVSAVLFRREPLQAALERDLEWICDFRVAGDWITYLDVLEQGDIAYVPDSLNLHRRHSASVTIGSNQLPHMLEVLRVQRLVNQRYSPSPEASRIADDYIGRLYRHFGLNDADALYLQSQLDQPGSGFPAGPRSEPGLKPNLPKIVSGDPAPYSSGVARE